MWNARERGGCERPPRAARAVRLVGVTAPPPGDAYRVTRTGEAELRGGSEAAHREMQEHAAGILRYLERHGFSLDRMSEADFERASRLLARYPGDGS